MAHGREKICQSQLVAPDISRLFLNLGHPDRVLGRIEFLQHTGSVIQLIAKDQNEVAHNSFREVLALSRQRFLIYDHNAQVAVHRQGIAGVNQSGGFGHSRNAWQAVFPGDDGPMDQHAAPAFHHGGSQRDHKGHIGINRVTHQYFAMPKLPQILIGMNDPGRTSGESGTGRLTDKLPGFDPGLLRRRTSLIQ